MAAYDHEYYTVSARLSEIGVPGDNGTSVYARLYPVLDRLYLRPEGEPDTADLVGRINEACDCIGIVEGPPDLRVRMLAERCDQQRDRIATLEAELGQLDAKPQKAKPKCKVRKSGGVTLRMTSEEASVLREVMRSIGGCPVDSARRYTEALDKALSSAGVEPSSHKMDPGYRSIYFEDFA